MADITKRVAKKAAPHLAAGEQVLAALLLEPKGTYGAGAVALAAAPRTAIRALDTSAAKDRAEEGAAAGQLPAKSFVLVVTDRRVVAMPSNGLRVDPVAASFERHEVTVAANDGRGLGRRLTLAFADGTSATVDGQRGQPYDAVTQLLGPTA